MSRSAPRGDRRCKCCSCSTIMGFVFLIYWLSLRPHQIRVYMDSATLSGFSLSNATSSLSLSYNISLTLSLRNPNRKIGIYYDSLSASAFYNGSQLGPTESNFDPFFQHTKTTHVVYPAFEGTQGGLSKEVSDAFNMDKNDGAYNMEVKLNAQVRYKLWFFAHRKFEPDITCWLKFPLVANGNASMAAQPVPTKCHVKYSLSAIKFSYTKH